MLESRVPEDDLALARRAAQAAALLLAEGAGRRHDAEHKGRSTDLVTDYDRRAEAALLAIFTRARPDDRILAEEGGAAGGQGTRRWICDPLDGTTNFAHGLPFFCVSVALEVDGALTVGVVDAPALGWQFFARAGGGAWLVERGAPARRLSVSDTATLARALLATGFPYDRQTSAQNNFAEFVAFQRRAQGVRRVGAAALDLAMTAAGWFDGYWEMKLQPWDLAAGALLVSEAGGRVSSWSGGPFSVDEGAAVATNGSIHEALLATLRAPGAAP
jgi:myo-inositol-1(or 4)-monophosphatase